MNMLLRKYAGLTAQSGGCPCVKAGASNPEVDGSTPIECPQAYEGKLSFRLGLGSGDHQPYLSLPPPPWPHRAIWGSMHGGPGVLVSDVPCLGGQRFDSHALLDARRVTRGRQGK